MKTPSIIGLLLIVVGLAAFAYHSFSYTTTEKAIDLGPIQVTTQKEHSVPVPPIFGGIAILGGVVLLLKGGGKS